MPLEAQLVQYFDIYCASSGIDEGTGCNYIYFIAYPLLVSKGSEIQVGDVGTKGCKSSNINSIRIGNTNEMVYSDNDWPRW